MSICSQMIYLNYTKILKFGSDKTQNNVECSNGPQKIYRTLWNFKTSHVQTFYKSLCAE